LTRANLEGIDLGLAQADSTLLDSANLSNARLTGTRLSDSSLRDANLERATVTEPDWLDLLRRWHVGGADSLSVRYMTQRRRSTHSHEFLLTRNPS
jgi:uncharacterized protein YjbI with pentapeptide repeats